MNERVRLTFARIAVPRFTVDVDELRAWTMDIRQVLSDNTLRDVRRLYNPKVFGRAVDDPEAV